MINANGRDCEKRILEAISGEEMRKHIEFLCGFDRDSGTEGEYRAVEHLVNTLEQYDGVQVKVYEFDAYLSYPRSASVEVVAPVPEALKAKTRSFSGSTPPEGVTGEIVYVPGGSDMFRDFETSGRFAGKDLAGKIVLSEGGGRQNMRAAQELGAVGYIHLWPSDEEYLHQGIVTPVWGTPTPETAGNIPRLPVVTVTNRTGKRLNALAAQGPVKVRIFAKVETDWRRLKLPVATIKGESEDYVLAAGHVDSWHRGATDNATGNATLLELARVFGLNRAQLKRSLKLAWWPGHSTGRYAGSTWFADHFWFTLHDHCVTYINIDSPGPLGAVDYSTITAVAENGRFAEAVVRELTGQNPKWERPVRAGDQSFWGAGVTSLFMLLSERPPGQRAAVGGSGSGWWWHTEEDTIDKVSLETQVLDTKIHALAITRLCTLPVLPFVLGDLAGELKALFAEIDQQAGHRLDFGLVRAQLARFAAAAEKFDQAKEKAAPGQEERFNRAALAAIRAITPVNYTKTGPFDHDPAVPTPPLPGLHQATALAGLNPESDQYRFLLTRLVRESNRVAFALREAAARLEEASREPWQ
jgi:hypothetical protein